MRRSIALIGDSETAKLLNIAGVSSQSMHIIPENELAREVILEEFERMVSKEEIAIIFISRLAADLVSDRIASYTNALPAIFIL